MAKTLNKWGYKNDMAISNEEVGAYLFAYGQDNKVNVVPIDVTDAGFEVRTIDATISQLNESSQVLYYQLKYGKKE
jgi:hypothetical protein